MLDSKTPFKTLTSIVEELIIYLLSSMYLIKRYDFFNLLMENLGINVEKNPEKITNLAVSDNFQGNFWRLKALYLVQNSPKKVKIISKDLETSEKYFL